MSTHCAMRGFAGWGFLALLMTVAIAEAQNGPSIKVTTKCLGNVMRVDAGPLGGKRLEVAVVINNSAILLSPSLASQCGFSVTTGQPGNAAIYASVQNCFSQKEGEAFTTTLSLRLHGNQLDEDELYQVAETCQYSGWASREIVCTPNYMEVSVKRAAPEDYVPPHYPFRRAHSKLAGPRRAAEKRPVAAGFGMTTLVFLTPERRIMKVTEALKRGYGIASSPSRLVLRSPKRTPETYMQNVAGVPMTVLKIATAVEQKWRESRTDAAAACPVMEGSVFFTPHAVAWYLPWRIDPLVSSGRFQLLEVHVGVGGQRLSASEVAARQYSVSVSELHVVVEIPVGAVGGHFKSHVQDNHYLTSYSIEPMVELLWTEDATRKETRYKVLFPITTPLQTQPLQVIDQTLPEEQRFKMLLGPLGTDVALVNVTFPSEVLSVSDCNVRGFNVMERTSPNSSSKIFTLEVPFTDPAVLKMMENGLLAYSLQLTFGFLVLPELAPFSLSASLQAKVVDMVRPSVSGICDPQSFYLLVKHGTQGFHTVIGKRTLTPALARQYRFVDNGTHFSLVVPSSARDVAFEAVTRSHVRGRLDVALRNPDSSTEIKAFSMACNFRSTLTECFPNGTMAAWAVKLESVPSLNTSQLTLRDPSCGPSFSDDRLAYFIFTGSSCGTTRTFVADAMLYENEISLPRLYDVKQSESEEPVYELKVLCYYDVGTTQAVSFQTRRPMSEPDAENAKGELQVAMRIALDESYSVFYRPEDYPIVKYPQQPLYFEVELMRSANPKLSLELENCWATPKSDKTSWPRWNLIIEGCTNGADPSQVVFHPVWTDARVRNPSHFKRFEVQMFAFADDQEALSSQVPWPLVMFHSSSSTVTWWFVMPGCPRVEFVTGSVQEKKRGKDKDGLFHVFSVSNVCHQDGYKSDIKVTFRNAPDCVVLITQKVEEFLS